MDSMVTARMPQGKKETGNSVLRELGTNPSQLINDVYDYVIKNKSLPFKNKQDTFEQIDIHEALTFIKSIPLPASNRFATMTDDEIKQERLNHRLLAEKQVIK